ncbi:hypothetical protein ATEG_05898 [Paecilomyces variotii No. 5]|uniref:FAD-binding domain-containing protein n=1 Tax=Byssochlamys spectabilis (strain No. 5 / NBRC 109023) TaxID=1356009 RepID=V5FZT5_BYSSN|nr:hypothetical protein ATEG_05898 [Paecilomyces variotii No. 5]
MATQPFKVLIAGGSVSGLTLALTLESAGIDYELFEKGDIDTDLGASIAINGPIIRILDQLGVWEDIEPIVTDLERSYRIDGKTGHVVLDSDYFRVLQDEFNWPIVFLERRILLKAIYNRIKNKSKVHSHAAVIEYQQDTDGIAVTIADGTSYQGDILVGTDGIHSHVRTLLSKHIGEVNETLSTEINNTFVTEYQVMFGISHHEPTASWLADGRTVILTYDDKCSGIITKPRADRVFWFLVNKIRRTEYAHLPRYTQEDAQALIDKRGDLLIAPGHSIRELWDSRIKATLVPMEEGVVKKWSDGRVLLIGDSVHKFTINAGLGGNMAFEAVAHLTNRLVSLLKESPRPTSQDLSSLFDEFESAHRPRAELALNMSTYITRLESQDSLFLKFYSRYVMPRKSAKQLSQPLLEWLLGAPWLEFVPLPDRDADLLMKKEKVEKDQKGWASSAITWSAVATGLAMTTVAVVWGWRSRRA